MAVAIDSEVLVIGGGIAGLSSALSAAQAGADVRLVSEAETTLHHASGLLDVLGYPPNADVDGPVVDPFDAIGELPETHPYAIVGEQAVRDGLAMIDDVLGEAYHGSHTDANALVPTHGGTVKPTARYPTSVAAGLASDDRELLLVDFERLTGFDAGVAAEHLEAAGIPAETNAATVEFPIVVRDDAKVTRYAHLLDENPTVTVDGREQRVRTALADAIEPHLGEAERVGFPAVLGVDHPAEIRNELEDRLGAAVFEVPMGPPSILGGRLEDRLYAALDDAGGEIEAGGGPIVDFDADDGTISEIYMDRSGSRIPYAAEQYVLATGDVAGGGIDADRAGVTEPIFGCDVPHPEDRYEWFEGEAFGDHAFAEFGVVVDDALRPVGAEGDPEFPNLRAAGAVIGGYDYPAEKSASGVSIATGYAAGRRAAKEV
ncbi:putative anaerobic glycerol-3-phosphate dehydrogenase subunit B protein [Halorhabdus tiamatea SARL4B]|uniref:Putative anaerobic glycerol-3-phosphate dehydrogenase subunit B protein n=1 Tax=Halorhabdus tiamatea SARL4B TaxID=1033806 RepID=U2E3B8_9EURY|nr:putative anaerobic glycerol-3-phosphate dehydrogenase subunit B protein [Halorhabdus tiamatea SARL4B]